MECSKIQNRIKFVEDVSRFVADHGCSEREACKMLGGNISTFKTWKRRINNVEISELQMSKRSLNSGPRRKDMDIYPLLLEWMETVREDGIVLTVEMIAVKWNGISPYETEMFDTIIWRIQRWLKAINWCYRYGNRFYRYIELIT